MPLASACTHLSLPSVAHPTLPSSSLYLGFPLLTPTPSPLSSLLPSLALSSVPISLPPTPSLLSCLFPALALSSPPHLPPTRPAAHPEAAAAAAANWGGGRGDQEGAAGGTPAGKAHQPVSRGRPAAPTLPTRQPARTHAPHPIVGLVAKEFPAIEFVVPIRMYSSSRGVLLSCAHLGLYHTSSRGVLPSCAHLRIQPGSTPQLRTPTHPAGECSPALRVINGSL